jgi:hypothetical protein
MATIDLVIGTVGEAELQSYEPPPQYWALRKLLAATPSSSPAGHEGGAKLVVIRIEFRNSSEEHIEIKFDNMTCKAELLGLEVQDDSGATVHPVRRVHMRPKSDATVSKIVPAKGKYLYDLVGEVAEGWLVFPGAKYQIPSNGKLNIKFQHRVNISNVIELDTRSLSIWVHPRRARHIREFGKG